MSSALKICGFDTETFEENLVSLIKELKASGTNPNIFFFFFFLIGGWAAHPLQVAHTTERDPAH
jgi:hypothetical protein